MAERTEHLEAVLRSAERPTPAQEKRFLAFLAEKYGEGTTLVWQKSDAYPGGFRLEAGAEVYDTIVGKAAAALFILGGVRAVYAETISDSAVALLERAGVECRWGVRTGQIVNRTGDGLCPFEQAVLGCAEPADCLPVIRETLARLRTAN